MSELTLVVLAAGMGSRFSGDRIKQLEPLGPSGELLIDYSVRDALQNGFSRVLFIIRKDIEELFKSTIGARCEKMIKTEYVFQSTDNLPARAGEFPARTKPWGTAQALYCCKDTLNGDFAVINADDFYGAEAFEALAGFFKNPDADACSVDFLLKNTLSKFGAVNRGICRVGENGLLTAVEETKQIKRGEDGVIKGKYDGFEKTLDENSTVSMSMWGFKAGFMERLSRQLKGFLSNLQPDELKAELTIADAVSREIISRGFEVRDIPTDSRWFGITYESDVMPARELLLKYYSK